MDIPFVCIQYDLCVQASMHLYVCVCVCVPVCLRDQSLVFCVLLIHSPPCSFETQSLTEPGVTDFDKQCQGSTCLSLPNARTIDSHHCVGFLMWVWG